MILAGSVVHENGPADLAASHAGDWLMKLVVIALFVGLCRNDPHQGCARLATAIITGGHDNTTARTVALRRDELINAPALTAMFRQIIANNRAGGRRKIKKANSN